MAWEALLPSRTDGTESMLVNSATAVSPRMAVSMVLPKSGESMAMAMFMEPRLQEMSSPMVS